MKSLRYGGGANSGEWVVDTSLSQVHVGRHWVHGTRASGGSWELDTVKPSNANKTIQVNSSDID